MMNEENTQQLTSKIWLGPITAKWSSSNSNVARVDTNGKVTSNVTLKVNTSYKDGKILITYTIKNKGNASSTYRAATDCDTKFQDNDRAPIKYENNQIIVTGSSTNMYIQSNM